MHRVLATLVATALLIGCGEQSQRAAYLASAEAHAAAYAAAAAAYAALGDGKAVRASDAAGRAFHAANQAADAVGTDEFYPAVREADAAAENAWEEAQVFANWKGYRDPKSPHLLATALKAALKARDAAERAMASHD